MTARLTIRTLGSFVLERDGLAVPDSGWHTRQAQQLLKILVTERGHTVAGDRLIEWLWPDSPPQAAAVTLRTTASALRHVLEPEREPRGPSRYIVTRAAGYGLALDEGVWLDVAAFENSLDEAAAATDPAAQRRALEVALPLYRGEYLQEDRYVEWALVERDRLSERFLGALADLAELCATSGEYERAVSHVRRLLAHDPGRESAYRALMLYQARAGDIAAALRTFERCRRQLAEELGVDPAPQTRELHEALLRGEVAPGAIAQASQRAAASSLPPFVAPFTEVFVGREVEAGFLRDCLRRAVAGEGTIVALEGETGVGKTRLALGLLEEALQQGVVVLAGRCLAIGESLPFTPLMEAFGRLIPSLPLERLQGLPQADLAQLAQLLPRVRDRCPPLPEVVLTNPAEDRQRLVDGIARVLLALAERERGLILFLDDLQWIDEATLGVVARLASAAPGAPLLLVLAYSMEEVSERSEPLSTLRLLTRHGFLRRLTLARLGPLDVSSFIERLAVRPDERWGELAEHLYRLSEGNALFMVETVRALLDRHGWSDPGLLLAAATSNEPPHRVRDVILARVERLPAEAREVLDLAAVVGRDFPLELLEAASLTDPLPGLETLLKRHFLREESGGRLDFTHQLGRRVVYDELSALARRRLHRRVADSLGVAQIHGGSTSAERAFHYRQSGEAAAKDVLHFSVQAGDEALLAFGFRQAAQHYEEALAAGSRLEPAVELRPVMCRAYHGRGSAFEALGDHDSLVATYHEMRAWAERTGDAALLLDASRRLVASLAVFGYLQESSRLSADMVAQLPADAPIGVVDLLRRIVMILRPVESALLNAESVEFVAAPAVAARPEDLVSELGAQQAVQALNHYGWTLLTQGQLERAKTMLEEAVALASTSRQIGNEVVSRQFLAQCYELAGDWTAMASQIERSLALGRKLPAETWARNWLRLYIGFLRLRVGRVDEARDDFRIVHAQLAERAAFPSHRLTALVGLGWVSLREHDVSSARRAFDDAMAEGKHMIAPIYVWACLGKARAESVNGDIAAAGLRIRKALAVSGSRGMPREHVEALLAAGALAHGEGRAEDQERLLEKAGALARRFGLKPAALEVEAARLRLNGSREDACGTALRREKSILAGLVEGITSRDREDACR